MKRYEELYDVLNKELQPALGCTEPAAVTYACAVAAKALGVPAEKVEIAASKNILKNVMGVGIPNTDSYGITAAAAMGVQLTDIDKGLQQRIRVSIINVPDGDLSTALIDDL